MILIIIIIISAITLAYVFTHYPKPREVLRYNTKCELCGAKKGILKCRDCGV